MDQLYLVLYGTLGGVCIMALIIILVIVAGKDIAYAFNRKINKRKKDVFVVDNNKDIKHHFIEPKEGLFKINGVPYITNPYKLLGLTDDMVKKVQEQMDLKRKRIINIISRMEDKLNFISNQIKSVPESDDAAIKLDNLNFQKQDILNKIELMKSKLEDREHSYYYQKRGAYFYIENDPVPKDFFEWFTDMDSHQLENVIIRAQTKDPKNIANMEQNLVFIKKIVLFALIAAAAAAAIAIKNSSMISEIGAKLGVQFSI